MCPPGNLYPHRCDRTFTITRTVIHNFRRSTHNMSNDTVVMTTTCKSLALTTVFYLSHESLLLRDVRYEKVRGFDVLTPRSFLFYQVPLEHVVSGAPSITTVHLRTHHVIPINVNFPVVPSARFEVEPHPMRTDRTRFSQVSRPRFLEYVVIRHRMCHYRDPDKLRTQLVRRQILSRVSN